MLRCFTSTNASQIEASFSPMIDVALAGDVVGGDAVMWQADDRFLPAARPQFAGIVSKRPANALDVVEQPDFAANELADPNRHGIGAMARAADVHERLHRQYRINGDVTDPDAPLSRNQTHAEPLAALQRFRPAPPGRSFDIAHLFMDATAGHYSSKRNVGLGPEHDWSRYIG